MTSDLFTDTRLGPQWEWNYQPRADRWSLTERLGYLRLKAFAPLVADNLTKVGNTLTQRVLRTAGGATVTVRLELAGLADGQHAGLCHYAATYAGLGVRRSGTTTTIAHNADGTLTYGPAITQNAVWLRTTWDVNGVSRFSYSLDGNVFSSFSGTYQLTWGGYRGDRVGLYTYNPNSTGYVDVDSVQYTIAPTKVYTCVSVRSGKVAELYRASNADGAAVIQWPDTGASNQQWAFQSSGDGYHTIACVRSGKVLDVAGSSTTDGAAVVQMTADGRTSQQWQLRPQTGGEFVLVNRNSGKVLDVKGGSTADGVALIQYRDVGSSNQRWTFHRVTG
ncbi:RICIN domain-containing protein [Streptomyces viridochromogenes]|uniref:RICIN domain-containing protein n=1 Tax=Streptomyces viridochromogenes TaxID=1938 RepID=UPI001F37BCD7|nr:RICIN domain-containing protein [Streptomyces viridochromogenes]